MGLEGSREAGLSSGESSDALEARSGEQPCGEDTFAARGLKPRLIQRVAGLAIALAAFALVDGIAPHLPDPGYDGQVIWLSLVSSALLGFAVVTVVRLDLGRRWVWLAVCAAAAAAALTVVGAPLLTQTVAKLVCAASLGCFLALVVENLIELLAIAAAIAVSDIISVLRGPTHLIAAHHSAALDALMLHFHAPGTARVCELGMTDVLFFAAFLTVSKRLGLRVGWTAAAMACSLAVTTVLAAWSGQLLPALPLLAAFALLANADRIVLRLRGPSSCGQPHRSA